MAHIYGSPTSSSGRERTGVARQLSKISQAAKAEYSSRADGHQELQRSRSEHHDSSRNAGLPSGAMAAGGGMGTRDAIRRPTRPSPPEQAPTPMLAWERPAPVVQGSDQDAGPRTAHVDGGISAQILLETASVSDISQQSGAPISRGALTRPDSNPSASRQPMPAEFHASRAKPGAAWMDRGWGKGEISAAANVGNDPCGASSGINNAVSVSNSSNEPGDASLPPFVGSRASGQESSASQWSAPVNSALDETIQSMIEARKASVARLRQAREQASRGGEPLFPSTTAGPRKAAIPR